MLVVALLYDAFGKHPQVRGAIEAVAMAAAGLIVAMGAKIVARLQWRWPLAVLGSIAFLGTAVFGLRLVWLVAALAPIGIAIAWMGLKEPGLKEPGGEE
jgi:chromate transporter